MPGGRQHRFLASETYIWSRLVASNVVNWHICNVVKQVFQQISAPMIITNMGLTHDLSSSPKVCLYRIVSRSDSWSLSTRQLKPQFPHIVYLSALPTFSPLSLLPTNSKLSTKFLLGGRRTSLKPQNSRIATWCCKSDVVL